MPAPPPQVAGTRFTQEDVWRRYDSVESRLTAPVSERMLDLAAIGPGMRVLDLATGRGEPALRAARRVGPTGRVVGIDPSAALLRMAREYADADGLTNLDLRTGDAESLNNIAWADFHAATVRWGLMYMGDPVAALAHARRALRPEGVLVAALWAEPERVPYYTSSRRLLARHRRIPEVDPDAPGMFRYADLDRVVRDFGRAGFTVGHVEEMDIPLFEAETAAEVVAWARALGSGLGRLLDEVSSESQRAWEQDLRDEFEQGRTGRLLRVAGVTRIVRAHGQVLPTPNV